MICIGTGEGAYLGLLPDPDYSSVMEQLESWINRRRGAVLGQPFYQQLLANMAEANLCYVWLMIIDGEDTALVYAFVAHGQLHFYWTAFKLKYESSLSIGQMLIMQVVRDACEEGILSFDFIHGEAEYKRFWATDCYNVDRVVACRGLLGRLIATSYYVVWQLVRIKLLKSFYRRVRRILLAYKQRTTNLSNNNSQLIIQEVSET